MKEISEIIKKLKLKVHGNNIEIKEKMIRKITFFFTYLLFCINLFGQNNGRPIKLVVSSLIEAAKIKNFNYDKNYKYTIIAKEINDSYYKYQYLSTVSKEPISDGNKTIIYTIIIENDGFDNPDYVTYKIKWENKLNKILKSRFNGIKKLKENCRYELDVEEKKINNEKYLELKIKLKQEDCLYDNNYPITIEKDGLDDDNYIRYKKKDESVLYSLPKDHFNGIGLKPGTRYVLKVKEVVKGNETYLELVEQLEPKPFIPIELIITIEPFYDYSNIPYTYINKKGTEVLEYLNDTFIVGMKLEKGIKYKLIVKTVLLSNHESSSFELVKQLEPIPRKDTTQPCPNLPPTVFYNCKNVENRIATCNEVIYTQYYINSDNTIDIRPVDYATQDFYKFSGKICDFTFTEDHKYVLEVKKENANYRLVNILCDQKMDFIKNPGTIQYDCLNNKSEVNPPIDSTKNGDNEKQKTDTIPVYIPIPPTNFKPKSIDDAKWYLRYLFLENGVMPFNNLTDTSYSFTTKTWKKTCLVKTPCKTPCSEFEANIITDDDGLFTFENINKFYTKCDSITHILIDQLITVKKYEIINNVLKLSINGKDLIQLEGFPK